MRVQTTDAVPYELMLGNMLQTVSETERLHRVNVKGRDGEVLLHLAARSGNIVIHDLYPESERLQALDKPDDFGGTALHDADFLGNLEAIKFILALYPESDRLRAVNLQDQSTVTSCGRVR